MSVSERPGVYSSYEVTSALYGSGTGRAVGVAGVAAGGTKGAVSLITSYAAAASLYGGSSSLTGLVKVLLENGAPVVYAVPVVVSGTAARADYEVAFAALMERSEIGFMVCDSRDEAVHAALLAAISGGEERSKYRIGIVESAGTASALVALAEKLNSERMALVGLPAAQGAAGAFAAAAAGVLAAQNDPALPLGGAELAGVTAPDARFSDSDVNVLIRGGVTPIEALGGIVSVIRGVTTRTTTNGTADATWRELSTILIVDDVLPTVRDSLKTRFARTKNTAQTRGAIRTQVVIELENKKSSEIIEDYGNVTVTADESDPTVCNVRFSFTVVHGLNRIELVAHITV